MSQPPKRGLGKGFEALLPTNFDRSILLSSEDRIEKISIEQLTPNPNQPRKHFDNKALQELAESIKRHGVVQPLLVTPTGKGYTIVAGERRWRASKIAGLNTVPAVVHKRQELDQLEIALIENVQRVDLSPLEQAVSIGKLHEQFNLSHEQIAKRLGKASSTVANIARLLNLPLKAKEALTAQQITEGHARQILALNGLPEQQAYLLTSIIRHEWNVRQAEQFVSSIKSGIKNNVLAKSSTKQETTETKILAKRLSTPVTLKRLAKGGKLEIRFKDDEDLQRIIKLID